MVSARQVQESPVPSKQILLVSPEGVIATLLLLPQDMAFPPLTSMYIDISVVVRPSVALQYIVCIRAPHTRSRIDKFA